MTMVHNVTVASPPTSAGKGRSTSLINMRDYAKSDDSVTQKVANHSRSRTRTIAPEESLLYQRKLMSASLSQDDEKPKVAPKVPVAYEINFNDVEKKVKKSVVKQKSSQEEVPAKKTDDQKKLKRQKSSLDPTKQSENILSQQKTVIERNSQSSTSTDSIKKTKRPLERQKTFVESEAPPTPPSEQQSIDIDQNDEKVGQREEEEAAEEQEEEEENYESDFESYESDFEAESEHSSGSEESEVNDNFTVEKTVQTDKVDKDRVDSGSFDMSIKKSATPSSAQYDSIDDTVNSHDSGISYDDLNALNRRLLSPKVSEFYRRGEELMKKITFDEITFDIFEQKPIPYEVFMSIYGQRGMTQAGTQSDSIAREEETQTENVLKTCAWTQFPARFTRLGLEMTNSKQYNEEKLGVGTEVFDFNEEKNDDSEMSISAINNFTNDAENFKISTNIVFDPQDLNNFVQNASITVLNLIKGKSSETCELMPSKMSFSSGYLHLKYLEVELLRSTIVTKIYTNLCLNNFFVTIHNRRNELQTLMCLWNILETTQPQRVFCAWSNIKCLEIHPQQSNFIIGGCDDGTVCLWNTQESGGDITYPCEVISLSQMQNDFTLDNVVALKSIPQRKFNSMASMFEHTQISQIASLHENGIVSVWTLIAIENVDHDHKRNDLDFLCVESKVKLVKNLSIDLTKFTKNDEEDTKNIRKKTAFEKTRYYFENDLFSDKVLQELQEIDTERLQKSKKFALYEETFTATSFDINFNELFAAYDSNFIVALSRLCLGDKARKIITNESSYVNASVIKVHPVNKNILAVGQSNGNVKFIKTSDESDARAAKHHKQQLKRSNATSSSNDDENVLAKSCAFQNIVEREKKLYEETQALNNLELGELKAFMVNEDLSVQLFQSEDNFEENLKITFDKNVFNSFDVCMGAVKAIEFSKSGELMFVLVNKILKIFNCWTNVEVENEDNQMYADVKCIQGSNNTEYLILLTTQNEILVNKIKF